MSAKKHWILFRNQVHYDDDLRWTDVRLRPSHFDELSGKYDDERGVTHFDYRLLAARRIPDGLTEEETVDFELGVYADLKAEILAQAKEKGIDPDSLAFAWDEGFGKLDPAMPKKNVSKMFTMLSQGNGGAKAVRWMKNGEMDTGYYPYGKLWEYVSEQGGKA